MKHPLFLLSENLPQQEPEPLPAFRISGKTLIQADAAGVVQAGEPVIGPHIADACPPALEGLAALAIVLQVYRACIVEQAQGQPRQLCVVAQLQGAQKALIPGGLPLGIGTDTPGATQIDMLRAVQVGACQLAGNFQQGIKGPPSCCTVVRSRVPLAKLPLVPFKSASALEISASGVTVPVWKAAL